ncbi:MAG: hypothetical protein IT371_06045 [Deltaproteobacteria bacterium]|nr:hypothetical protein [Deltaproteobacteria bacterium]
MGCVRGGFGGAADGSSAEPEGGPGPGFTDGGGVVDEAGRPRDGGSWDVSAARPDGAAARRDGARPKDAAGSKDGALPRDAMVPPRDQRLPPDGPPQPTTQSFGNYTVGPATAPQHFAPLFDLTRCDATLTFTLNLAGLTKAQSTSTMWLQVGLREEGAADLSPGLAGTHPGGKGGWVVATLGDLGPDAGPEPVFDIDDHLMLQDTSGGDERHYDARSPSTVTAPFGGNASYGLWFDRDGVDQWQAQDPWTVNGGTYNTAGVYRVQVKYHAVNATSGTMFGQYNGIQTGYYPGGWHAGQPDIYPAGLSFRGNLRRVQLFVGQVSTAGLGGSATITDLKVQACAGP